VLAGLLDSFTGALQQVLHAAAGFVLDLRPRDHISLALQYGMQTLHWLPVRQRITYKPCVRINARRLWTRARVSTGCRDSTLRCQEERICGQRTVPHTTDVIAGGIQSVPGRGPESLESASRVSASHGLCCDFQASLETVLLSEAYSISS